MPEYEYSAYIVVRANNLEESAERVSEAQGLLARMTTVVLHLEDSPPIELGLDDEEARHEHG